MIDKEEPLFIMMMEHHSRKQSIRNNIWAYCSSQWSSVSQNSVPFLSRGLIVYDFLQEKWANFMNYCVTYVFPLLTFLFRPSEFVFSRACLSVLELSDWQDATLTYWVILPPHPTSSVMSQQWDCLSIKWEQHAARDKARQTDREGGSGRWWW